MPPKSAIEDVRKSLKINKKQFLQCWEVLIYLGLDPVEKHMEDFESIISNHVKYDILGKDSGTSGKQLIEVPCEYEDEISFVMFRTEANTVQVDENQKTQEQIPNEEIPVVMLIKEGNEANTVQVDETQRTREEQLQKLVEEKMNDIKMIAEKVTAHRVKC